MPSLARPGVVVAVLLLVSHPAGAAPPRDAAGDLLPSGARARLGTVRLRHGGAAEALAFRPDGRALASVGQDRLVSVWEVATGRELVRGVGHEAEARAVAFAPDGSLVASGAADGIVRLWDATPPADPSASPALRPEAGNFGVGWPVDGLAFLPDGTLVVAGKRLGVWNRHGQLLRHLGPDESVAALVIRADGKQIAALGEGGAFLCDSATGRQEARFAVEQPRCLALTPDGQFLAVGCYDARIVLIDLKQGKELATLQGHGAGRGAHAGVTGLAFSPDGRTLASSGGDGTLRLWDRAQARPLAILPETGRLTAIAWSMAGERVLASAGSDGGVRLWDAARAREIRPAGPAGPVTGLAPAPDGRSLVVVRPGGPLQVWDLQSPTGRALDGTADVRAADWTPDGRALAVLGPDAVRLLDPATGRTQAAGPPGPVPTCLVCTRDGKGLGVGTIDRQLTLCAPATGQPVKQTDLGGDRAEVAAAGPGRLLAVAGRTATVWLWDPTGDAPAREFATHPGGVLTLTFSPTGRVLAAGGRDRAIRLWEVATGGELRRLPGHLGWVRALAFSAEGRVLASGGSDGCIRLWDVAGGRLLHELVGHRGAVTALVLLSDGTLVSAGQEGTVLTWDTAELVRLARPTPLHLTLPEAEALWQRLGQADAIDAHLALQMLARDPDRAVELARRLRPVDPTGLRRALRDLDDEDFTVRQKATQELQALGRFAEPSMRLALASSPPLEVRQRLVELLRRLDEGPPDPTYLRALRGVELLEVIGTPPAGAILSSLATGTEEAELTRQARLALERLRK